MVSCEISILTNKIISVSITMMILIIIIVVVFFFLPLLVCSENKALESSKEVFSQKKYFWRDFYCVMKSIVFAV